VARSLTTLCQNLLVQLDHLDLSDILTEDELGFAAALVAKIRANASKYLEFARGLPRIVL
jgi:hypothetical protein